MDISNISDALDYGYVDLVSTSVRFSLDREVS